MLRTSMLAACGLALAMFAASPASAQFGRGMQIPPSVQNIMMMRAEAVQKELNLNADQTKEIADVAARMQSEAMEIFSGLQDLNPEERQQEMPGLIKMMTEKGKELQGKVDKILDAKQNARMKELSLQQRGPAAFEDEAILTALKITEDQKNKLIAIRDEAAAKQQEIMAAVAAGGDRQAIGEKVRALQKELGEKALAVLTAEQNAAFEKMKGVEFKFPQGGRRGGLF